MDSGFYAACAALMSKTQALDTVANNLANVSTAGFRAERSAFSTVLQTASGNRPVSELNQAINNYGVLGGTRLDLSQGPLEKTRNDMDFAIEGSGFFVVQTPTGRTFTRGGNFGVSKTGQLVTAQGDPVMGEQGVIPIIGGPVSVSADGTISVNGAIAGKLKLVDFAPGADLKSIGRGYYTASAQYEQAPKQANIQQGMLEGSNVNPILSVVDLIGVQRTTEMVRHALSMFHSQMDQTAARDLPQVGS